MKAKLILLLYIYCFIVSCFADNEIARSEWYSTKKSKGGLGSYILFGRDNKVSLGFGALLECKYKFEENVLYTYCGKSTISESVIFSKKTMELKDKDTGKKRVFSRINTKQSKDNIFDIIGKWSYKHYTGKQAYVEFTSSGKMFFRLTMMMVEGSYKKEGQNLIISTKEKADTKFVLSKDKKFLTEKNDSKKRKIKYKRLY